jgi:hypothetical protein
MRPAPFFELLEVLLVGELLDLTVDVDSFDVVDVDDPLVTGVDDPAVEDGEVPLISAATVALKVPVMPVRVNLAENASAKAPLWVGFGRLLDVKRIKYAL